MPLQPVLPLRDMVLFPGVIAPLFVARPRSLKSVENASLTERAIFAVYQPDIAIDDPSPDDLAKVGTLCRIIQMVRIPDGSTKVLIEGSSRAKVKRFVDQGDHLEADIMPQKIKPVKEDSIAALRRAVMAQFERYVELHPKLPIEIAFSLSNVEDINLFADVVASHSQLKTADKQDLLETLSVESRLDKLIRLLTAETELLEMERSIHDRVRQEIEKSNKEFYLREQIKVIQSELGQGDQGSEQDDLAARIKKAKMPKDVEQKAQSELDRLAKMPYMSAEATVSRNYIEWLTDLPWKKRSDSHIDLRLARKVLDEDHYGLDEVKDRILEFLAVQKMLEISEKDKTKHRGQVLCFVGPPGVGKTSLGRSIARALGRKFVSFSLGGVHDEAEIRGHRRTYIGSLPGRIIQKMKQAGVHDPVMLMDEIDKIGTDFRGDPSSALLEVLDPEQNANFTDHFLEVPFDLSSVMFITTANSPYKIPAPLRDRMELISIPGYVVEEKMHIAQEHLWPKVKSDNGLRDYVIDIPDPVMQTIISEYTLEAGVRDLDRQLAKLARKAVTKIVDDIEASEPANDAALTARRRRSAAVAVSKPKKIRITKKLLAEYLGAPKTHVTNIPRKSSVGAALGLAWTSTGGDVLLIECAVMKGYGERSATGNLGEVMSESVRAALSYLRANDKKYGLTKIKWKQIDLHVHVPEGAIPKDGPSAGVTLALSMLSALTGQKVRADIAMTGEITLRGTVLPIGGVREKILAAKRHGIYRVIVPKDNKVDAEELAEWARDGMTIHYVSHVSEVFKLALESDVEV